ncbi:MAG: VTT domain-containing protein [Myxococcota bacterium]
MKKWTLLVLLVLVVGAAFAAGAEVRERLPFSFSLEGLTEVREWVVGFGWRGPAVFVALVTFRSFLLLPSYLVLALGGLVFGAAAGTLWGAIGLAASSHMQYFAARVLGDDWVRPHLGARHGKLEDRIRRLGPAPVFALTAHPAGVLTPLNITAGLVGLAVWEFAIAIFLAVPIRAGVFAVLGTSVLDWGLEASIAAGLGLVLLVLAPLLIPSVRHWVLGTGQGDVSSGSDERPS